VVVFSAEMLQCRNASSIDSRDTRVRKTIDKAVPYSGIRFSVLTKPLKDVDGESTNLPVLWQLALT
jgi:hypothetical protein